MTPAAQPPVPPRTAPDERPARRSLLDQIGRLEAELGQLFCSTWPRKDVMPAPAGARRGGRRPLALAELEELRDELAGRVSAARHALGERTAAEERNRRLIEEMTLAPERHKWVRVRNEDIGEPGCKSWHVRPRLGLLGMALGRWRVVARRAAP